MSALNPGDIDGGYSPAQLAMRDQAIADSSADLRKLVNYAVDGMRRGLSPDDITDVLTRGFIGQTEWDEFLLATVLGVAVARLAEKEFES